MRAKKSDRAIRTLRLLSLTAALFASGAVLAGPFDGSVPLECLADNGYGVQIMTPAYEGDPEQPKVVASERQFPAPAKSSDGDSSIRSGARGLT